METAAFNEADVRLFGKYAFTDVECADISLVDYIAKSGRAAVYTPHSAGRWHKRRFHNAGCPIVERMVNSLMMHGR